MLQGSVLEEDDFAGMRALILRDLCNNYHRELHDGQTQKLDPHNDYEGWEFGEMKAHFLAIQRRAGGGSIHEASDENRRLVQEEFLRLQWTSCKPPEMAPWSISFVY